VSNILKSINQVENLQGYAEDKRNPLNRLNPIVKILVVLIYVLAVVSCNREELLPLIMLSAALIFLFSFLDVPAREIFLRVLIALPFAALASVWNIFVNREVLFTLFNINFSAGVVSFLVVIVKTILSVSMILALSATTKLTDLSFALKKLRVPEILITQLLLTYKYLLILFDEAFSISTAAILRSGNRKMIKMKDVGVVVGTLLLKSIARAERVYNAMKLRGFKGYYFNDISLKFCVSDVCYLFFAACVIVMLRYGSMAVKIEEYFFK